MKILLNQPFKSSANFRINLMKYL